MSSKKINNVVGKDFILVIALLFFNVVIQIFFISKFINKGIPYVILYNIGVGTIIWFYFRIKKIELYLVAIYLLPYIILSNLFHYAIKNEIIFNIPIFLLMFFVLLEFFRTTDFNILPKSRFLKILLSFLIYSLFSAIFGLGMGHSLGNVLIETFHIYYYALVFVFLFLFKERDDYFKIMQVLLVVSVIISLGYILMFALGAGTRFVTFQMNFLPFALSILITLFVIQRNKLAKFVFAVLFSIILLGTIVTLTRSLWVTVFVTIGTIILIHLKFYRGWKFWHMVTVALLIAIILGIGVSKLKPQKLTKETIDNVDYRAASIFNPSTDLSFLMRIELNYYALIKFFHSPVLGTGIGDWVNYKVIPGNPQNQYYLDNSWLQIFWKQGIVGGLLFIYLYWLAIKNSFDVFKRGRDPRARMICLGLFAALIGVSLLSLLQPMLIKYKSNVILALLLAYIEFETSQLPPKANQSG